MIGPSLSVVQTLPSRRRKLAPALSSPPKQHEPSNRPGANHLNPTGTSDNRRPSLCTTRSIMLLLTKVLPTAAWAGQSGRASAIAHEYGVRDDGSRREPVVLLDDGRDAIS